jgi:hypothetical protein
MPGQTKLKFEFLRVFPCACDKKSERVAFAMLDHAGARKPGSRKELFTISLAKAVKICTKAARAPADEFPQAWSPTLEIAPLKHSSREWKILLEVCVKFRRQELSLGTLMAQALVDGAAAAKLATYGVHCVRFDHLNPTFQVTFGKSQTLTDWVRVRELSGFMAERVFTTKFKRNVLL